MQLNRVVFTTLAVFLITACGSTPETPAYFEQVTSLDLCEKASVKNINADDPARSPGFDSIYRVRVAMDKKCVNDLVKQLRDKSSNQCQALEGCAFRMPDKTIIFVEIQQNGLILTQST